MTRRQSYLKRLPAEQYLGQAYVHWTMTMDERKTGWLVPIFYYKFREILTHAAFRYGFCCPIYCCMPDHIHLLWVGILPSCDQRLAARYFRQQLTPILNKLGASLQKQGYDHVLKEDERQPAAFADVFEYIARNPERARLLPVNGYRDYAYTGCLMPGYPELKIWEEKFLDRFWKIFAFLKEHGLMRTGSRSRPDLTCFGPIG